MLIPLFTPQKIWRRGESRAVLSYFAIRISLPRHYFRAPLLRSGGLLRTSANLA